MIPSNSNDQISDNFHQQDNWATDCDLSLSLLQQWREKKLPSDPEHEEGDR